MLKMAGDQTTRGGVWNRFSWLVEELPGFGVKGSQVKVLVHPADFYQELLARSRTSSRRIVLSSLYLGTGNKEKALLQGIQENVDGNKNLRINVLLDWCRGTRMTGQESSASLLANLVRGCRDQCRIAMYHTPHLRGLYKRFMPARWNETIGLQHCKIYIFDDSVIISGANLSNDYFTNRQDRYILVENCEKLADFYDKFVQKISEFSLQMDEEQTFKMSEDFTSHPFESCLAEFKTESNNIIKTFLEEEKIKNKISEEDLNNFDTWIFPTVQMGPLDVTQDSEVTVSILRSGEQDGRFVFGSGYFNLTQEYLHEILHKSKSNFDLIMAHPKANGFLGARGAAGGIPHAYTHIANTFYTLVGDRDMQHRIRMHEYQREGWTFHAKGLWYYPPKSSLPCMTMVGSPNFGYRSVDKDLETQITILTTNQTLQEELGNEESRLFQSSSLVCEEEFNKPDRQVPGWVKLVVGFARHYF